MYHKCCSYTLILSRELFFHLGNTHSMLDPHDKFLSKTLGRGGVKSKFASTPCVILNSQAIEQLQVAFSSLYEELFRDLCNSSQVFELNRFGTFQELPSILPCLNVLSSSSVSFPCTKYQWIGAERSFISSTLCCRYGFQICCSESSESVQ